MLSLRPAVITSDAYTPEFWKMFLVVIQLGAILAVVLLYFRKLNPFALSKTSEEKKDTWILWFKVLVACVPAAIIGILFEDEGGREDYFQKLRRDLLSTLEEVGCGNAIVHKRGMLGVVVSEIQCDYYDCLSGKKSFSNCYFGEYMSQYSWAEDTLSLLALND